MFGLKKQEAKEISLTRALTLEQEIERIGEVGRFWLSKAENGMLANPWSASIEIKDGTFTGKFESGYVATPREAVMALVKSLSSMGIVK